MGKRINLKEDKIQAVVNQVLLIILEDMSERAKYCSTFWSKVAYGRNRQHSIKSPPKDYSAEQERYVTLMLNILTMIPMDTLPRIAAEIDSFLKTYNKKEAQTDER